jgi:AbrB family looped-hinge helix DNA binding protein
MIEIVSAVTRKGQVTIPRRVRQHLGIATPDQVAFVLEPNHGVRLLPAPKTLESVFGSVPALPDRPETVDFEDQIAEAMDAEADRIVRGLECR